MIYVVKSPDGRFLLFLSAKSAVESGAHCATNSLHRMNWSSTGKPDLANIIDLVGAFSVSATLEGLRYKRMVFYD